MAGITCTACGANITVRGLSRCPICQGPVKPITDQRIVAGVPPPTHTEADVDRQLGIRIPVREICIAVGIGAAVLIIGWGARGLFGPPSADKLHNQEVGAALAKCQQAILSTAQYGDAETPPFVQNHGRAGEFYFAWPRGKFEFSNGFGARVPMSASCIGVLSTGEIKSLTINSKDIL